MEYLIAGVVAFIVSIASSISGGGGGLVITPLLLLLGFPPQNALASGKGAGLGINIGTLSKFLRVRNLIHWKWAATLTVIALCASLIGTQIVIQLDNETLRKLVGITTIVMVPISLLSKNLGTKKRSVTNTQKAIGAILYLLIFSAHAGLGSGIGAMLMFVLMGFMGLDALSASATKRVPGLMQSATSFTIFAFAGLINWVLALALFCGMLIGGYIGAHLAVNHGNELVKKALLIVALVMGVSVLIR